MRFCDIIASIAMNHSLVCANCVIYIIMIIYFSDMSEGAGHMGTPHLITLYQNAIDAHGKRTLGVG